MNKNVFLDRLNRERLSSSVTDTVGRHIPEEKFVPKKIEFASEIRKNQSASLKEAFGFSHGGVSKHKKKKKK